MRKICKICGKKFEGQNNRQCYCSNSCRKKENNAVRRKLYQSQQAKYSYQEKRKSIENGLKDFITERNIKGRRVIE